MRGWMALAGALMALLAILVLPPVPTSAVRDCPPFCASPEGSDPNDGRIGDWGGDYFVYGKNGFLEVWRLIPGTNRGEPLAKFPLGDVANLHQRGDSLYDPKSGVTVTRWGDRIEVSGWGNGNNPFGRNSTVFKAGELGLSGSGFKNAREKLNALKVRVNDLVAFVKERLSEEPFGLDDPMARAPLRDEARELAKELEQMALDENNDSEVRREAREARDLVELPLSL